MGLLSGSASALDDDSPAPTGLDYGRASLDIAPAVQQAREAFRRKTLQNEIAGVMQWPDTNPQKAIQLQALNREAAAMGSAPVTVVPAAPRRSGLFDSAIDALNGPDEAPASTPAPAPSPAVASSRPAREPATLQAGKAALNMASGVGATILGGWRGLAALASGAGWDEAVRQVNSPELAGGQTARAYQSGTSMEKAMNAPGALLAAGATKAGEVAADYGVPGLNLPPGPASGAIVNTAIQGGPLLTLLKGKPAAVPEKIVGGSSIAGEAPALGISEAQGVPTTIPKGPVPVALGAPVARVTESGVEPLPPLSVEPPPIAAPGKSLPATTLPARAAVLQRIGLDNVRKSAVAGDPMGGAVEFQTSKFDEPAGQAAKAQFQAERDALQAHAERIVADTGGSEGSDAATLYERGNRILSPLSALKDAFEAKTKALYQAADARAQGIPMEMPATHELLGGDQADFLGTTEGEALLKGVKARMKSLGLTDAEGNPQAATVTQAEQLKQYLNNQWQPRTSRLIQSMKDAIDDDVTKAAGEDIYAQARAMRAMRSSVFENDVVDPKGQAIPNGVAQIVDASGRGLKLLTDREKIPDAVAGLSSDELAHLVQTLQNVPPEIQPLAQTAINEIKAHFAQKLADVGNSQAQWNAKGVTKFLNNNAAKLPQVFTPEEIAKMQDLSDAGHILAVDRSYPGAAAQASNALKRGLMANFIQKAGSWAGGMTGAALGSTVGAPTAGAAVGASLGEIGASRFGASQAEKAALARWQKGMTSLSELGK